MKLHKPTIASDLTHCERARDMSIWPQVDDPTNPGWSNLVFK